MKKNVLFFLLVLLSLIGYADVPKVYHVVKAKISFRDRSLVTYALVVGELDYSDKGISAYKKDSKTFTETVKLFMSHYEHISLYSQIFQVREKKLILLPKDRESKVAIKDIKNIALMEYFPSEYAGGQVYTHVLSSDSTWTSWKVSQTEYFGTVGGSGICGYTMLYFNKPDSNSKAVVRQLEAIIRSQQEKSIPVSQDEIDQVKERLRRLRIVVLYYCGC